MILADKIIQLRKKCGWSQEELADKMGVSRQSVSKWEGAQSVPDLDKILQLGKIFGVSTDFLLKDEMETAEYSDYNSDPDTEAAHRVSMEEANEFLSVKQFTAPRNAAATFLCIISPICLLILGAGHEAGVFSMSENAAGGIGMCVLLFIVACAVAVFISCGMKSKDFEYLEHEIIELEYGVDGMVKERMKRYHDTYTRNNVIGTTLCIISLIPLFGGIVFTENDFVLVLMICIMLFLVAIGVFFFVVAGVKNESMNKLLQQGDYTKLAKKNKGLNGAISSIFWLVTTAIYLAYSFITNDWYQGWIIWPVAGVLFAALITAVNAFRKVH